ncbi:MAG TPA: hypothetical protein VFG30_01200 [Polyangiales bacterium]|nr:hypothetical protein [Polyangiales bacterium]
MNETSSLNFPHPGAAPAALKYQPRPWGDFQADDGRWFSWHFLTYAAAVTPLKALLDPHGLGWRAFHFTNIAFFCAALLAMLQLRHSARLWLVLFPLAFLAPALWFLPLAHTEAFVFSLALVTPASHSGATEGQAPFANTGARSSRAARSPRSR